MDKRSALGVTVLCAAVLIWVYFTSAAGPASFEQDPKIGLATLAILLLIAVPSLWWAYRRARRNPTVVRIEEQAAVASTQGSLDKPVVLTASRWKILAYTVFLAGFGALGAGFLFQQTGVCRAAGAVTILPFLAWNGFIWAWYLLKPPQITLSSDGLNYTAANTSKHWRWDEVRDVAVQKIGVPGVFGWFIKRRPSLFVTFRRYSPPSAADGPPTGAFRSFWKMSGEDLGALLTAAHVKWSTRDGKEMIPVPKTYRYYLRTAVLVAIIIGLLWMMETSPCGATS